MVHIRGISHFEIGSDHDWIEFISRFEQLFNMNDVLEENKRAIFLVLCGDFYETLSDNGTWKRLHSHSHAHHHRHHGCRGHQWHSKRLSHRANHHGHRGHGWHDFHRRFIRLPCQRH